jgi:hypothetical protein
MFFAFLGGIASTTTKDFFLSTLPPSIHNKHSPHIHTWLLPLIRGYSLLFLFCFTYMKILFILVAFFFYLVYFVCGQIQLSFCLKWSPHPTPTLVFIGDKTGFFLISKFLWSGNKKKNTRNYKNNFFTKSKIV